MKFVVDRSKWRCGGNSKKANKIGKGSTNLRNNQGFMCCLGHCALQLGATTKDITRKPMPHDVVINLPILVTKPNQYGLVGDSMLSKRAANINDDSTLSLTQREKKLKAVFKRNHHEIIFKGKAVKSK